MSIPKKRILITALDWGLGHATRCMPIINHLLRNGHEVILASSGSSRELLLRQYPGITVRDLPAYNISYSRRRSQTFSLLRQVPKVKKVIEAEHNWMLNEANKLKVDAIISDNRYGCWHPEIPSAIICHQIAPMLPFSLQVFRQFAYKLHQKYLDPFDQVWIPDFEAIPNLSGKLSHEYKPKQAHHFIGPLSRFDADMIPFWDEIPDEMLAFKPEILILLSGPEPQRSILEQMLWKQVLKQDRPTLLVQGKPGPSLIERYGQHYYMSFLPANGIAHFLDRAHIVISRSGYSSLMDYAAMGIRKSILVPTPGQSEQKYLGRLAQQSQWAVSIPQHKFKLEEALEKVKHIQGFPPSAGFAEFTDAVEKFLEGERVEENSFLEQNS